MRRVTVILVDGLRPDVVTTGLMPSLGALGRDYARATNARTIRPSATVAALASLATGVAPETHGLVDPGLGFLRRLGGLVPLARRLRDAGLGTTVVMSELPRCARPVVATLVAFAGVGRLLGSSDGPRATAETAAALLGRPEPGLLFVYFPECDRAGHAHGWMSRQYLDAAAAVDAAIARITEAATGGVLIVTSDHGGGGVRSHDHDEPHPINEWIPLTIAGPDVRRGAVLAAPVSLLDIPPTILWHLGVAVPPSYEGRVLREAFAPTAAQVIMSA
jgi:Type I phosphodiesterase / nucleotide pyrophosphatase